MLTLKVSGERKWDEVKEEFIPASKDYILTMEHSLLSVSKWEAIYHKSFLATNEKDLEMIRTYAKCMTINNVPDEAYERLTAEHIDKITAYISNDMTATHFPDSGRQAYPNGKTADGDVITSELIYYWMTQMNIPFECQKWHLNKLLTLVRVISIKTDPKGGKGKPMTAAERKALNMANRAKYHTKG